MSKAQREIQGLEQELESLNSLNKRRLEFLRKPGAINLSTTVTKVHRGGIIQKARDLG